MSSSTKIYRAYTMAEALAAVKRDMGSDAVILRTRTIKKRRFLGLGRRLIMEVTAGPPERKPPVAVAPVNPRPRPATRVTPRSATPERQGDFEKTRELARAMLAKHERDYPEIASKRGETLDWTAPASDEFDSIPLADERAAATLERPDVPVRMKPDVAQRYILTPATQRSASVVEVDAGADIDTPVTVHADIDEPLTVDQPSSEIEVKAMQDELSAIRDMVGKVLQNQTTTGRYAGPDLPAPVFETHLRLLGEELDDAVIDAVINEIRDALDLEQQQDEDAVRRVAIERLALRIPVADRAVPDGSPDARPLTIALVGPTGVGKTTTLAKLAATFKVRRGLRVGLVTSDTYRIAAVEQLRTYANIIGLPLQVVLTAAEMRQAIHALSDCEVILIDTAGRGQRDANRIEELRCFVEAAEPHEVHLVISGTASSKVLSQEAEAFCRVGVDKVILSKMDESVSYGPLVNVLREIDRPVSFLTTGQEVPDHIHEADACEIAQRLVGMKDQVDVSSPTA